MKKQKAKAKNPLYVVKGKDVEEAESIVDLVIKKFNLAPMLQMLQNIFKMLLENVKDYQSFKVVKSLLDELVVKYFSLVKKFGLA